MFSNQTLVQQGPSKCTRPLPSFGQPLLTCLRLVDGAGAVCVDRLVMESLERIGLRIKDKINERWKCAVKRNGITLLTPLSRLGLKNI